MDNYKIAMENAQKQFLNYDMDALSRKFHLDPDPDYLYFTLLRSPCRISRHTGSLQRFQQGRWVCADTFYEVMTVLDLLCGSREDRCLTGKWQSTLNFGHQFHRSLLENPADPLARTFDRKPDSFRNACLALGGRPVPYGDMGYAVPFFQELEIGIFFWHSDEEFPPQLRYFWDENALMYLKYETMHYALAVLQAALVQKIKELENHNSGVDDFEL